MFHMQLCDCIYAVKKHCNKLDVALSICCMVASCMYSRSAAQGNMTAFAVIL